ncbi:MAG: Spy/CpxP family protein refolding chaperone [Bryobacteraceae bacterium]
MKNKVTNVLLASIFAASSLFAQGMRTPPDPATMAQRRVSHLTTALTLTTAQQQQATNIFTNSATANASVHTNLQAAHTAIKDAVQKNDTAGIDRAATTIGSLTAQLTSNEAKADAAFYAILTPAQQTQLASMKGMHGHGGGGGGARGFRHGPNAQ